MKFNWMLIYRAGAVGLVLLGIGIAFPGFFTSAFVTKTEFAFVRADIVPIRANATGLVRAVHVDVGHTVADGDILVELDRHALDLDIAARRSDLARLEMEAERIRRELRLQPMQVDAAAAALDLADERRKLAGQRLDRATGLRGVDAISVSEFEAVGNSAVTTAKEKSIAAQTLALEEARTQGLEEMLRLAERNIDVAKERLALTEEGNIFTTLRAPVSGRISKLEVHDGQIVVPGETFIWVVSDKSWIEARFKESDIRHVCEGGQVDIALDGYKDLSLTGTVAAISTASAAEFSALPTRRGAGNFTKVVQWIPVRIEFDRQSVPGPLASGMSAEVRMAEDTC